MTVKQFLEEQLLVLERSSHFSKGNILINQKQVHWNRDGQTRMFVIDFDEEKIIPKKKSFGAIRPRSRRGLSKPTSRIVNKPEGMKTHGNQPGIALLNTSPTLSERLLCRSIAWI